MMPRFFSSHSVEEAQRAIPPGALRTAAFEGSIASLPMATLKHIARAAEIAAQDFGIQRRIELLIRQNDPRGLGRYLETLGAEGKLGSDWSFEHFVSARGIKKTKSRAGRRISRKRIETGADTLRRRAIVVARRIGRKLVALDDLALFARFDAVASTPRGQGRLTESANEAIDHLAEMIAVLDHVMPVDPKTWRKLTGLVPIHDAANQLLSAGG